MPARLENDENAQIKINKPEFGLLKEDISVPTQQALPTTSKTLTTQGNEDKFGSFDTGSKRSPARRGKVEVKEPFSPADSNRKVEAKLPKAVH
jgi:hypothetical protein